MGPARNTRPCTSRSACCAEVANGVMVSTKPTAPTVTRRTIAVLKCELSKIFRPELFEMTFELFGGFHVGVAGGAQKIID